MPFIGIYANLFPSSKKTKEKEPEKPIIRVTVLECQRYAVDDDKRRYEILNAERTFSFFRKNRLKFEIGKSYLAEISYLYKNSNIGLVGEIRIIKINSWGILIYL